MGYFLPAMIVGGLGMGHRYATKELDEIIREGERPTFGFGWGVLIGLFTGWWVGYTFHGFFYRVHHSIVYCLGFANSIANTQGDESSQPEKDDTPYSSSSTSTSTDDHEDPNPKQQSRRRTGGTNEPTSRESRRLLPTQH
eukprot:GHVT01030625.1.p1 GENE.GHVT01030625.1~~GHVT01030625.1.p1  ORF type:complete len:140 (+),score=15.52 GHVT01030625.1:2154-2573(+)